MFNSYFDITRGYSMVQLSHGGARCFIPRTTASADAFGSHPLVWQPSETPQKIGTFCDWGMVGNLLHGAGI